MPRILCRGFCAIFYAEALLPTLYFVTRFLWQRFYANCRGFHYEVSVEVFQWLLCKGSCANALMPRLICRCSYADALMPKLLCRGFYAAVLMPIISYRGSYAEALMPRLLCRGSYDEVPCRELFSEECFQRFYAEHSQSGFQAETFMPRNYAMSF